MRIESIVINASPLITLFRSGQAHIWPGPCTLRAVIDDMDARRCAQTLGIPIFGTGGLLVLAKRRSLLPSVSEAIAKLRHAGLWLSDDIAQVLRAQAGE